MRQRVESQLDLIRAEGTFKRERPLSSPQTPHIAFEGREVINFCANNYLGLADHPAVREAAHEGLEQWGFGMASVRFICGTQDPHLALEQQVSAFLGTDDTVLFSSCFDANSGVFEALLGPNDAVISDELNHASLIDGIRLSKARRLRYRNRDLVDLRTQLEAAQHAEQRIIVTDGVFSMDGSFAPLPGICDLADEYGALVLVDDSHAVGCIGATGRGTPELFGVDDRIDLFTGTFGTALGGAVGGYVSGRREVVALLRQRARPYLFSNSLPPAIVAGTRKALSLAAEGAELRLTLAQNTERFRTSMAAEGFELLESDHPIIPVVFHDTAIATRMAELLFEHGIYVAAFSFPMVPLGTARIRVQLSALHSDAQIDLAVAAFVSAREALEAELGHTVLEAHPDAQRSTAR